MNSALHNMDYDRLPCRIGKSANEGAASGLIDDIMKKYFCQKAGQESSCSVFSNPKISAHSMDKRLEYWSKILDDRKRIACRIQRATGKRFSHVLYNQTEGHRNVQTVKRVIDTAQRLQPTKLLLRKVGKIKDTLFETLPRSERLRAPDFEIVGIPNKVRAEQWLQNSVDDKNSFLRSSYLQRKLKSNAADGTSPLEFYPDIDRLEVVGSRIHKHSKPIAEVISEFELSTISSGSKSDSWQGLDFPESCLQINDTILRYRTDLKEDMVIHLSFKCTPYESATKTVCQGKNLGKRPVYLQVRRIKPKGSAYFSPLKKTFHFNVNSIRLAYGELVEIEVTFRPDEPQIYEDIYCLLTDPNFIDDPHKILFKLTGDCFYPQNYFESMVGDLLNSVVNDIIPGTACDSAKGKPILSDKEIFERENPGFKCEQGDLQEFCKIYRQVKRKHHPNKWDMNLQSLKELIEGVEDFEKRTVYSNLFTTAIRKMQRRVPNSDSNISTLLARTAIVDAIDKWERKAQQIQHSVAITDLDLLIIKMPFEEIIERINACRSEKVKRRIILHNALFIQMFCSLCELAEDIASYVENSFNLNAF